MLRLYLAISCSWLRMVCWSCSSRVCCSQMRRVSRLRWLDYGRLEVSLHYHDYIYVYLFMRAEGIEMGYAIYWACLGWAMIQMDHSLHPKYNPFIAYTMQEETHPPSDTPHLESMLRRAEHIIRDQQGELKQQQARIKHLELHLKQAEKASALAEDHRQEAHQTQEEVQRLESEVQRLERQLQQRDESDVGFYMVTNRLKDRLELVEAQAEQRQNEAAELTRRLEEKHAQLMEVREHYEALKEEMMDGARELTEKHRRIADLEAQLQNLTVCSDNKMSEQKNILRQLEDLSQRHAFERQQRQEAVGKLNELTEIVSHLQQIKQHMQDEAALREREVEELKNVNNGHEWKVFCLETEVDLGKKEKSQLKGDWELAELKLAERESQLKEQRIKIFAAEEDTRIALDELKLMKSDNTRLQNELARVNEESKALREYNQYLEKEHNKDLEFLLKEKDEQISGFIDILKGKISETDEHKLKSNRLQLDKEEITVRVEKLELENYELEQSVVEHQHLLEQQSHKIDQMMGVIEQQRQTIGEQASTVDQQSGAIAEMKRGLKEEHGLRSEVQSLHKEHLNYIKEVHAAELQEAQENHKEEVREMKEVLASTKEQLSLLEVELALKTNEVSQLELESAQRTKEADEAEEKASQYLGYKEGFEEAVTLNEALENQLNEEKAKAAEERAQRATSDLYGEELRKELIELRMCGQLERDEMARAMVKLNAQICEIESQLKEERSRERASPIEQDLNQQTEGLNQTIINLELEKSELLKEQQMLRRETEQLTDRLIETQAEVHQARQQQSGVSREEAETLKQAISEHEKYQEEMATALVEAEEKLNENDEKVVLLEKELEQSMKESNSLQEQIYEEAAMRKREEAAADAVRKRLVEMKLLKELEQEEFGRTIVELQKRVHELEEQVRLEQERTVVAQHQNCQQTHIDSLSQSVRSLEQERGELVKEMQHGRRENEQLTDQLIQLQREKAFLYHCQKDHQEEVRQLQAQLHKLQEELGAAREEAFTAQKEAAKSQLAAANHTAQVEALVHAEKLLRQELRHNVQKNAQKDSEITGLRQELTKVNAMAHSRIQEITSFLAHQQDESISVQEEAGPPEAEETTAFELLGEEDFETLEEEESEVKVESRQGEDELWRQKKEIIRKMDAYLSEINDMTGSYRRQ